WCSADSYGTFTTYAYTPFAFHSGSSGSPNLTNSHPQIGNDYIKAGGYSYSGRSGGRGGSGGGGRTIRQPIRKNVVVQNGGGSIASTATTTATNIANIASAGAQTSIFNARHLSDAQKLKYGVNALKGISKGATAVGSATTYGFAIYEWLNGQANTHTIVDVGICTIGLVGIGFATFIGAPVLAIGTVVFGTVYGISSAAGLGTTIDKASDNWGHKLIYGDEKDN
ncbi:MAG: hypothetical protein IKN94_03620, partial [Salinivirgaceae bacterium]|nr:hypothetical protein [Salinivirgaceae bacterium]